MTGRLWYPQLDVYDCIRRLGLLLVHYSSSPGIERLYIVDFYLANPPLLHRCKMSQEVRRSFTALKISRPEKVFLDYPAPPLLFNTMEPIQKEALRAMTGKGLVSAQQLSRGVAQLTAAGQALFQTVLKEAITPQETELAQFLTEEFAPRTEIGALGLRRSTGLRRVG